MALLNIKLVFLTRASVLQPHQDGPAYYPVVAILSLGSPVVMDFTPHPNLSSSTHGNGVDDKISDPGAAVMNSGEQLDNCHPFSIVLMPRSLLIFKDLVYSGKLSSWVVSFDRTTQVTIRHTA